MAKNTVNRYIEKEKATMKEKKTLARANKHINLGLVVYFLIFAYLIFIVLSFSLSEKTSYSLAEPGMIVDTETFTGLIIKDEVVSLSNISGTTSFFVPEGDKVKQGSLVSCIDMNGVLTTAIKNEIMSKSLEEGDVGSIPQDNLQDQIKGYVLSKKNNSFGNIYGEKKKIEKVLFDMSNTIVLEDKEVLTTLVNALSSQDKTLSETSNLYYAPKSGVVSYNFDGFESLNIDNFTTHYLGQDIVSQNAFNETAVLKGSQLFKIVSNYKWYIAVQVNEVFIKYLEDKDWITIYVSTKDIEIKGRVYKVIQEESNTYVILEFDRYLDEFLDDRFIDFTINYFNSEGIKIPLSAITTKDFLKVPAGAIEDLNHQFVVKKQIIDEKVVGGKSLEPININIYTFEDEFAYIPVSEKLQIGDTVEYILEDGTNVSFIISEKILLEGVYVINKGYAAFKLIETLSFNTDYKIIKDTTGFGVTKYDRIATDASTLKENQIIK